MAKVKIEWKNKDQFKSLVYGKAKRYPNWSNGWWEIPEELLSDEEIKPLIKEVEGSSGDGKAKDACPGQ